MTLHTVDPTTGAVNQAVRDYLRAHPTWPIRYDADGTITNTLEARGRWSWYVLIDQVSDDAVEVTAVRRWLGGRLHLREPVGESTVVAGPGWGDNPITIDQFTTVLDVAVTMALTDLEAAKAEEEQARAALAKGRHRG